MHKHGKKKKDLYLWLKNEKNTNESMSKKFGKLKTLRINNKFLDRNLLIKASSSFILSKNEKKKKVILFFKKKNEQEKQKGMTEKERQN